MRPHVPPDVGVVVDPGRLDQLVGDRQELLVVAELARHFEARVGADLGGAGARHAAVGAVAEGRVGGQRGQHRQAQAHRVGDPHGGLRVGHADVDVEARGRRREQARQVLFDHVVARLRHQLGPRRRRRDGRPRRAARPRSPAPPCAGPPSSVAAAAGVAADPRLQLDLGGEDLGADGLARGRVEALDHPLRVRDQPLHPVDQEQLFLDADRQRRRAHRNGARALRLVSPSRRPASRVRATYPRRTIPTCGR